MTWQNLAEDILSEFAEHRSRLEWEDLQEMQRGKPLTLDQLENLREVRTRASRASNDQRLGSNDTCRECRTEFRVSYSNQIFCNPECCRRAHRPGPTPTHGVCEWCGEYYQRPTSDGRPARFCSSICKNRHWNHHNRHSRPSSWQTWNERQSEERRARRESARNVCEICGTVYQPRRKSRFCGQKCNSIAFHQKEKAERLRRKLESNRKCAICSKDIGQRLASAKLCGSWACAYRSRIRSRSELAT